MPLFPTAVDHGLVWRSLRRPKMPIGLIASSWGGTAIEPWMSPSALDKCGEPPTVPTSQTYWRRSPSDPGLSATAVPSVPSTLFNSMIAPLLVLRVTGWLWYQGESNSLQPQRYACLFPALIAQWRADWAAGSEYAEPTVRPFLFVQLAPWPDGDVGSIAGTRYAQLAALALPSVGMVVAADLGDAAGANHPIHPPWKQELGRRAALVAESVVFKNQHAWAQGPLVTAVHWDEWQPTWGADHFGSNPGGGVCANGGGHGWRCGGIRVTFDRPITLRNVGCTSAAFAATSAWAVGGQGGGCAALGSGGGFTLWNDRNGTEGQGTLGPTGETLTSSQCTHCDHCPCAQPLQIYGVLDDAVTLQLNVTFISGTPRTLKYAWSDYPSMSVFDADPADGRPAPPFNATIAIEVERPNAGTQRVSAR